MTADTLTAVPAVSLTNVSYKYGEVFAVDGLDLTVAPGEVLALLGPNGAGKSTSINLLLGLLPPASGSVRLFGRRPGQAISEGRIGAMLQENRLLPRTTVTELLKFTHDLYADPMPIDEVLALTDLTGLARRMTEALSGGQQQRVRFALALIGQPDILVLDEPTAALDVEARRDFWTAMRGYVAKGRTVLFSTHYLEEADDNADRIVVVARGHKIADGTPDEIKQRVPRRKLSIDVPTQDEYARLLWELPGVVAVDIVGSRAHLSSIDSDATVLAMADKGIVHNLEVVGANLEDAFMAITDDAKAEER
jgi:ABC-2 type transport system ATP-binding protein